MPTASETHPAAARGLAEAPPSDLENGVAREFAAVERWLRAEFAKTPPPFYASVDLRNDGRKIAPIDTNLFPAGFNNLPRESHAAAVAALRLEMDSLCPNAKRVILAPENHTRNEPYFRNVAALKHLLESAGIETRLGIDGAARAVEIENAPPLYLETLRRDNGRLAVGDFSPCAIVLNNDFSEGAPPLFADLEIPTLPPIELGWQTRRKSEHFSHYERISEEFAAAVAGVRADDLRADFSVCRRVDFMRREGMECLAAAVEETVAQIAAHNRARGVAEEPFVVVKADAGTYGLGVISVKSADEARSLNRKQRTKMAATKGGVKVRDVLIQEGVRTIESVAGAAAEPVVYVIGETVIGGFYRLHPERGSADILNARGMSFAPLPFPTACAPPSPLPRAGNGDTAARRLYAYGVVARLAALAAAREKAERKADD